MSDVTVEQVAEVSAKMLRNQLAKSRRKNRRMKGEGFEQMVVGNPESKGQWVFGRRSKCRHCQNGWEEGEVVLVSADMDVLIHADCIVKLADDVGIANTIQAELETERLRIQRTGTFYGRR